MNLSEFKAWFEGFTEAMDGPPSGKAWKRIQEKVKEIKAEPTPWPTIIREYVPWYPTWSPYYPYPNPPWTPYWVNYGVGGGTQIASTAGSGSVGATQSFAMAELDSINYSEGYNTQLHRPQAVMLVEDAFRDFGRLDAAELS